MASKNSKFSNIKIGQRVRLNYGRMCGEAYGKVYGRISTKWGESLRIKLDDYTFTTVESFVTQTSSADNRVGAYLIND